MLIGGLGADTLIGGDGVDTASYVRSSEAVSLDLENAVYAGGEADGDVLIGIENLVGSANADVIMGDGQNNLLRGLAGDDMIFGGDGADRLIGGLGDDVLQGDDGADLYIYQNEYFGNDTIVGWEDGIDRIMGFARDDFFLSEDGGSAVLTLLANPFQSITLQGISSSLIDATDFVCPRP